MDFVHGLLLCKFDSKPMVKFP